MKRLQNEIKKEARERKAGIFADIEARGYTDNKNVALSRYLTVKEWEKLQEKKITRADAVKIAKARAMREIEKAETADYKRIEEAAAAEELRSITITVEWKKSSVWGYNPTARVVVCGEKHAAVYYGKASGCGYDKGSAAISKALNCSPVVMRSLYIAENKRLTKKQSRRDALGYGSGYGVLPYFEGGVGVSAFSVLFDKMGYEWENTASGDSFDVYKVFKKGAKK